MLKYRVFLGALLVAALAGGAFALLLPSAQAAPPDLCVQRPLPPALEQACRGCLDVWAPVDCTVRSAGGELVVMTFSNQCKANCSGYKIVGECVYVGP